MLSEGLPVGADEAAAWRPRVTVACVIEREDARFLLVEEEIQDRLVLNQPAGHLDPGETLLQAAVRETLEETAWQVRLRGLIAVYHWRAPGSHADLLRFTFAARALEHDPKRALDTGIARALWLSTQEIADGGFALRSPMVLRSIADYRSGKLLPLECISAVGPLA